MTSFTLIITNTMICLISNYHIYKLEDYFSRYDINFWIAFVENFIIFLFFYCVVYQGTTFNVLFAAKHIRSAVFLMLIEIANFAAFMWR